MTARRAAAGGLPVAIIAMPSMCIITPTHVGDIGQFSVLRRSINLFAPGFPQIAIVNTEDFAAFRDRFAGGRLEIVKSSDVLPRRIERRRREVRPEVAHRAAIGCTGRRSKAGTPSSS